MNNLMINIASLKAKLPMSTNVDDQIVTTVALKEQNITIQQILGTPLYNDILTKWNAQTLSPIEEELMEYIQDALVWRSLSGVLPFLNMQIRVKGAMNMNAQYSTQSSLSDVKYLRDNIKGYAEDSENMLKKYLCSNATDFPLYDVDTDYQKSNKKSSYNFGGILLDKCSVCQKVSCGCK